MRNLTILVSLFSDQWVDNIQSKKKKIYRRKLEEKTGPKDHAAKFLFYSASQCLLKHSLFEIHNSPSIVTTDNHLQIQIKRTQL